MELVMQSEMWRPEVCKDCNTKMKVSSIGAVRVGDSARQITFACETCGKESKQPMARGSSSEARPLRA